LADFPADGPSPRAGFILDNRFIKKKRGAARPPRQFFGRRIVVDNDEKIYVTVRARFAAPPNRTGSPAAA
jgi:hypothetical protein